MRAYEAKAPQRSRASTQGSQSRGRGLDAGADQNVLHRSTSRNDQSDRTPNIVRKLRECDCGFNREDFIHGHTTAIQPLEHGELSSAKTKNLSVNIWNGRRFLIVVD
jgi:hypothetical protein